jgi:hypothetical protein
MPSIMPSSAMVNSMLLITATGDHDRPDWMIMFTGIRTLTLPFALLPIFWLSPSRIALREVNSDGKRLAP